MGVDGPCAKLTVTSYEGQKRQETNLSIQHRNILGELYGYCLRNFLVSFLPFQFNLAFPFWSQSAPPPSPPHPPSRGSSTLTMTTPTPQPTLTPQFCFSTTTLQGPPSSPILSSPPGHCPPTYHRPKTKPPQTSSASRAPPSTTA